MPQLAFQEARHTGHRPLVLPLTANINGVVVGVPYETMTTPRQFGAEFIHHDVGKQGSQ